MQVALRVLVKHINVEVTVRLVGKQHHAMVLSMLGMAPFEKKKMR